MEECNKIHNETTFGWVLWLQQWTVLRMARRAERAAAVVTPPRPAAPRLLVPR